MDTGLIFGILAAIMLAAGIVLIRKGSVRAGESFTAVFISVVLGIPFFLIAVAFTGEWNKLWDISWQGIVLLGMGGIVHFIIGRYLNYGAFRLIGVNKGGTLINTSPFYAMILAFIFLNEQITPLLVLGIAGIFAGAVLVGLEKKSVNVQTAPADSPQKKRFSGTELKGILAGLGGALCWGISPVLIKPGVAEIGSAFTLSFVGPLVSYIAATIAIASFLVRQQYRTQLSKLRFSRTLMFLFLGGMCIATGHMLNFTALSLSDASRVAPLISTSAIFMVIASFLFDRKIEVFTLKVILGMLATVLGAFLIVN